jgi:hypothetical protein
VRTGIIFVEVYVATVIVIIPLTGPIVAEAATTVGVQRAVAVPLTGGGKVEIITGLL